MNETATPETVETCIGHCIDDGLKPRGYRISQKLFALSIHSLSLNAAMWIPTEKINGSKGKCPPVKASFCPFCGKPTCKPEPEDESEE